MVGAGGVGPCVSGLYVTVDEGMRSPRARSCTQVRRRRRRRSHMAAARENRRLLFAVGVAVLAIALFGVLVGLRMGGPSTALWVDDGATPLAALAACVLCFRAAFRQAGRMRAFWVLFGCATACWTLAEVVWGLYALILSEEVPVPSWADVGYLSAIPLAVAGLIVHPAVTGNRTHKARAVLDGIVIATALLFLSWTLVLGPLWRSADLSTMGGFVTLAYPFGDIVIVFFIVLAIRGMTGGGRFSLWCLLAGLLAMAISDSTYTYLTEVANYSSSSGNLIDTGWLAGYLGIAVAAFASGTEAVEVSALEPARPSLVSLVSPLLTVILALTVAAVEIRLGHHLDHAAWLMAFALIAVVLTRQAVALIELARPPSGTSEGLLRRLAESAQGGTLTSDPLEPTYPASRQ